MKKREVSTMDLFKGVPEGGIKDLDTFKVFSGDLKVLDMQMKTDEETEVLRPFEEKHLSDKFAESEGVNPPNVEDLDAKKEVEAYKTELYQLITDLKN